MMIIKDLIEIIAMKPDCRVLPSNGLPQIRSEHILPDDLNEFYTACGGLVLYETATYPLFIVSAAEMVLANPVIVGALYEEDISSTWSDDISATWYIIAHDGNGDYYTIDLSAERLGRCYDSFWDRHAIVGSSTILALSFGDFLEQMYQNKGEHWYFAQPDFVSLGDAYDGISD